MGKLGAGQCARAQPEPLKSSRGASRPVSIESSHSELLCSTRYALYGIYEYVVSRQALYICVTRVRWSHVSWHAIRRTMVVYHYLTPHHVAHVSKVAHVNRLLHQCMANAEVKQ